MRRYLWDDWWGYNSTPEQKQSEQSENEWEEEEEEGREGGR